MKQTLMALCILVATGLQAQRSLTTTPSGNNNRAMVGEQIGLTDITIHYNRPSVKGREGNIWGKLVHEGYTDQNFGSSKAAPWRAGANEATTIEFSTDVTIEGQPLKAGKYAFFIAYGPQESTLIFSNDHTVWGSYFYDPSKDALRVKVKPRTLEQLVETLAYDFTEQTTDAATISLRWEKLAIPFRVKVNMIENQLAIFRRELRSEKSFHWQPWQYAAQWCVNNNVNLQEALLWADTSVGNTLGNRNFLTLSTRAQVLEKLGRNEEAMTMMKEATSYGSMNEIHQYARLLMQQNRFKDALSIFEENYKNYPNQFMTMAGMVRGLSATGDYKRALEFAQKALALAPVGPNKIFMEKAVELLKQGKDANQQ